MIFGFEPTITADEVQSLFDSAPAPSTGPIALTDANFQDAINLWFSAEANATALYGHISEWNVSAVTDMSTAFRDKILSTRILVLGMSPKSQI